MALPKTDVPPAYLPGKTYLNLKGEPVSIIAYGDNVDLHGTSYETVRDDLNVHRYNRRDFGRVTGTNHNIPDPRNLRYPPEEFKE